MLGRFPQTCDNILELPNYWESLVKTRPASDLSALKEDLERILSDKIRVCCNNAAGYGLDGLEATVAAPMPRLVPQRSSTEDSVLSIPAIDSARSIPQVASAPVSARSDRTEESHGDSYDEEGFDFEEENADE